jgi:tetratricopeptide (TPR) repeat protein
MPAAMDVEPVAMSEDDDDVDDEEDDDEEEEEDEEEAKLPTILQTVHHASDDDESDEDESDDEEEEEEDGDGDEEGRAMPPSMPPPPDRPAEPAAAEKQLQVFAARARPARAAPAGMAPPVSMNQVLADTARAPAKRRRAKGSRARGKGKGGKGKLPPDVSRMLGEANMCYVSQDFQQAIRMLEEVVRRAPRVSDPYHTLGLVYEEMDDQKRALECYLIAAYLTGKDVETWKRVATMSRDQGLLHQAIYCINRALRLAPGDVNAQYTRATVLVELGQLKKGSEAYKALLKLRPHDAAVAAEMARLHTKNGESAQAIKVLNDCLDNNIALANARRGSARPTALPQRAAAPVQHPCGAVHVEGKICRHDQGDRRARAARCVRHERHAAGPGGEMWDLQGLHREARGCLGAVLSPSCGGCLRVC